MVGVEQCGGGKWADIKKLGYDVIAARSAVDLKDKWRNLMRVAMLPHTATRYVELSLSSMLAFRHALPSRSWCVYLSGVRMCSPRCNFRCQHCHRYSRQLSLDDF